ncbi:HTH-type transcriptional activator RhaR [Pleomorphomonas sp. T1.2MG-36]|uniref:helix-turn-helix domain-containing protein n=1 Tax=Pleomorphomonas sp. T1.2MG-36 TaxID=3041167 RepID=UPI0024777F89|nr:AraC family transcriptional regulator [Pleomorphomonas sp. T1.2MG-36]CAI9416746.1 HTH-type transcriptional activator RhaR [Pleomorphomonas sp. T1.2MG-36]
MATSSFVGNSDYQRFELRHSSAKTVYRARSWAGFKVEYVAPVPGDRFRYEWTSDLHFCALHDIVLEDGSIRAGDSAEFTQKDLRNTLTYIPKQATVTGWSELTRRRNGYTAIYFDPAVLHEELDHRLEDVVDPKIYFYDNSLSHLMRQCARLAGEGSVDELYAETLGLLTALSISNATPLAEAAKKAPLSRSALARVLEFIDANLSGPISLADLAQVAALSRFHFSRAFKATTGETPYQFVLGRRIERVKLLLANTSLTMDEIAATAGFHDAAHLQKAFKAREGHNPLAFRQGLR